MNIIKTIQELSLFKSKGVKEIKISKRFEFGTIFIYNGKNYRYLYTQDDDDVLFGEDSLTIGLIEKKYLTL